MLTVSWIIFFSEGPSREETRPESLWLYSHMPNIHLQAFYCTSALGNVSECRFFAESLGQLTEYLFCHTRIYFYILWRGYNWVCTVFSSFTSIKVGLYMYFWVWILQYFVLHLRILILHLIYEKVIVNILFLGLWIVNNIRNYHKYLLAFLYLAFQKTSNEYFFQELMHILLLFFSISISHSLKRYNSWWLASVFTRFGLNF